MPRSRNSRFLARTAVVLAILALLLPLAGQPSQPDENARKPLLLTQSKEEAAAKSAGCVSCHGQTDEPTMHATGTLRPGCADCHGGDATIFVPAGAQQGSAAYEELKRRAHPQPSFAEDARTASNQPRLYTRWLRENRAYVRFVNPGDLRVAAQTCGVSGCHTAEVSNVRSSMMTHGAMLWNAALYNNGSVPFKTPRFGEAYDADGRPARLNPEHPPTAEQMQRKGVLPYLEPLQRWEISQPGNVLRVFERGGDARGEVGNPLLDEAPGRPDAKLSDRGFGTLLRTDPVFLGLQKTRLMDPLLSLPGTNDHPGDYRASGCSACHVVYANDSSPEHSGGYAQYGHSGFSASADPTLRKNEPGHPILHRFTRAIPSSQCMVCHMHPGTNMVATYFGVTWWDNEVDGELMYPATQHNPSARQSAEAEKQNPEGAAARGLWSDPKFLEQTGSAGFNARLKHTRFADFHSHGWIFRAVFKQDRHGQLLDADDKPIANNDPKRLEHAVQLRDIHEEKGMHCVDCHFTQDNHGNGNLYGETRNAVEIDCTDCHGTIKGPATLLTSGPAAPTGGHTLLRRITPWRLAQFYWKNGLLFQRSMLEKDKEWEVVQVVDTITPTRPHYNEQSRLAKTVLRDGTTWGSATADNSALAHANERMTCFACHSSWTTSCFGCHLSMSANQRKPMLHNEGLTTRNWTAYNFQVLRDDVYMLGVDGTVTGHRVAPVRSACAVLVSSQNQNRDWIYYSQQTVSAEGFSGQAFSPYVPHTVRARETRRCSDCHVSAGGDNNAWMAQLLMQGTGFVNQMGHSIYVASGKGGFHAVAVAERSEPEAVIGSDLHRIAYPGNYKRFVGGGRRLKASEHHAGAEVLDVQLRGEYLYAALGHGGFRAYDVANIENKDFSEKIVTAPVSPLGQRFAVKTSYATSVGSPSTLAIDPLRRQSPENEEQKIHPMYGFLYVTDRDEGLVIIGDANPKARTPGVGTLLDGDPTNNFLKRALAFNPGGALHGARRIAFAGTYAYVLCDRGLAVVDLDQPLAPKIVAEIGAPELAEPIGLAVQFRYIFVVDRQGLKVLDITHREHPQPVANAFVPLEDARNIYIARTYAYVAAGKNGIAIVDVERPEHPRLQQMFNAGGALNDTRDVKIGMTSSSLFAYVADGRNGLRVVQLLSPADSLEIYGFSPAPKPKLIATYHTHGPALAVSRGIDRDRAVDESGNQLAVFGRRGSRPFTGEELRRMYLRNGELYTVTDQPPRAPLAAPQTSAQR
jgi:hypothetical protein